MRYSGFLADLLDLEDHFASQQPFALFEKSGEDILFRKILLRIPTDRNHFPFQNPILFLLGRRLPQINTDKFIISVNAFLFIKHPENPRSSVCNTTFIYTSESENSCSQDRGPSIFYDRRLGNVGRTDDRIAEPII